VAQKKMCISLPTDQNPSILSGTSELIAVSRDDL